MKRLALVALVSFGFAACSSNPTAPSPSLGKSGGSTTTSLALNCAAQQLYVGQLIRRVDYFTTGEVRTTLEAPLNTAYTALNSQSCQPDVAIASLREFKVLVNQYQASGQITASIAASFISTANLVITNLGGTV